jgi:hypothetical protein
VTPPRQVRSPSVRIRAVAVGLTLCVVATTPLSWAEPEAFTAEEQQELDEVISTGRKACAAEVARIRTLLPRDMPTEFSRSFLSVDLCICAARELRAAVRPGQLRGATAEEGERLAGLAGSRCIVRALQQSWDDFCVPMLEHLGRQMGAPPLPSEHLAAACSCGQESVNGLKPEAAMLDYGAITRVARRTMQACMERLGYPTPQRAPPSESTTAPSGAADAPPVVSAAAEAGAILKAFGLEGRWSRDCANRKRGMTWLVYVRSSTGDVTIESWQGGDPEPKLFTRERLVSAHPLDDDRLRMFARRTFPEGQEERSNVVVKRIGSNMRVMQSTFYRLDEPVVRIRNGVFTELGRETPLLSRCPDD